MPTRRTVNDVGFLTLGKLPTEGIFRFAQESLNIFTKPASYRVVTYRSPFGRLLLLLCAFAVLVAQIFGVVRAYACDCSGRTQIVSAESCVGPHGKDCHSSESKPSRDTSRDTSDDHRDGTRKQHDSVTEDLQLTNVSAPPIVIAEPVVLAILPDLFQFELERNSFPLEVISDASGHPPLSVAVVRTVVLRL